MGYIDIRDHVMTSAAPEAPIERETIVFFHAHPDDEAIFSGGTIAPGGLPRRPSVFCRDGDVRGRPASPHHRPRNRTPACLPAGAGAEFAEACALLGVARSCSFRYETSYRPASIFHWPNVQRIDSDVAQRLADVIIESRPAPRVRRGGLMDLWYLHVHRAASRRLVYVDSHAYR